MAKFKIKPKFRSRLSEKLMDLGNFFAVTLVIGQFVSSKEFSIIVLITGIIGAVACYVASYILSP